MNDSTSIDGLQVPSEIIFQAIIFGQPASKANSRKIVTFGKLSRLIKSESAREYVDVFNRQVEHREVGELYEGDVSVYMTIWYASRRPDLDESLILDLLQGVAYVNDRQVKVKHIEWGLDPATPRVAITVRKMTVDPALMPAKPAKKKRGSK